MGHESREVPGEFDLPFSLTIHAGREVFRAVGLTEVVVSGRNAEGLVMFALPDESHVYRAACAHHLVLSLERGELEKLLHRLMHTSPDFAATVARALSEFLRCAAERTHKREKGHDG